MELTDRIAHIDWNAATESLHQKGYAIIPNVLDDGECRERIENYQIDELYRKTIRMEQHGYGQGQYKYFKYPLPVAIQQLRTLIYPHLAPVANKWMEVLGIDKRFPLVHDELLALCHDHGQLRPTPLILKYTTGGYNALHQDLYGDIFFPMQMVVCLNQTGTDFTSGEFVLVEQRPRMQSRPIVLNPDRGDLLIFTTNFRPVIGSRGYYRVNMRHGVSEVTSGERHTLGVIFHEAS